MPEIRHTVAWRVTKATALPNARLRVAFVDGTEGEVDMSEFLRGPQVDGTVFAALREREVFEQVAVVLGAVRWPNGADLAPDAMYDEIKVKGCWVLE
ncbi:MAG TPA: DUF2442 domain-containing protein [Candidatus Binatia bacterium]|nr:DUF2442 domain-containing protein [Candidatus Binatia bacterium]